MRSVRGGRGRGTGVPGAGVRFPGVGGSFPGERQGPRVPPPPLPVPPLLSRVLKGAAAAAPPDPPPRQPGHRRGGLGAAGDATSPQRWGARGDPRSCFCCSRCPRCVPAVLGALEWEQHPHPARDGEEMPRCGSSSCVQPWDVPLSAECHPSASPDRWGSVWILPLLSPHPPRDSRLRLHPRCRRQLLSQGSQKTNPAGPARALALGVWSAVASS